MHQYLFAFRLVLLLLGRCHGEATPYLDNVQARLREIAPHSQGKVWQVTRGNLLNQNWLLQSPDCWGDSDPDQNCARHNAPGALALAARIRDDISFAREWIDITTLANGLNIATGIFHEAIVDGIRQARARHPNVTIRIIGGTPPTKSHGLAKGYLNRLLKDLGPAADGARIFVAGIETYLGYSWSHAKMVAIDGKTAIVGGHNLWDEAYNSDHPVNDVSMRVAGPAASMAHVMADVLWNYTCEHQNDSEHVGFAESPVANSTACPKRASIVKSPVLGQVDMLAIGMLGYGIDPFDNISGAVPPARDKAAACSSMHEDYFNDDAQFSVDNPDLEGRRALLDSAKKSIFIAQQDLLFNYCNWWDSQFVSATYDARLFEVLAKKLNEGVRVTIVVSTPLDQGNTDGYSYMNNMHELLAILFRKLKSHKASDEVAKDILCKHLRLASVRITHNMSKWASGFAIGQHAKVFSVDDAAFYIGSHNLYPTTLQEFGYVVENSEAALHLKKTFSDKLWTYAKESAVIDPDAGRCIAPVSLIV